MKHTLIAQITNPAVPGLTTITAGAPNSGQAGANIIARYAAVTIQTALVLGGMAVLLYMFLGAFGWITAGGDSSKIEKARSRITEAIVGLAILFSVVAIATFLGPLFGLDLLRPQFINQLGMNLMGMEA